MFRALQLDIPPKDKLTLVIMATFAKSRWE